MIPHTRGLPKGPLPLARHLWVAGPNGEWLEERDGDTHQQLYRDNGVDLGAEAVDGYAIEGEIIQFGRSAVCWLETHTTLYNEAWKAFKTAEVRLLEHDIKTLAVATSNPREPISHIPLG